MKDNKDDEKWKEFNCNLKVRDNASSYIDLNIW